MYNPNNQGNDWGVGSSGNYNNFQPPRPFNASQQPQIQDQFLMGQSQQFNQGIGQYGGNQINSGPGTGMGTGFSNQYNQGNSLQNNIGMGTGYQQPFSYNSGNNLEMSQSYQNQNIGLGAGNYGQSTGFGMGNSFQNQFAPPTGMSARNGNPLGMQNNLYQNQSQASLMMQSFNESSANIGFSSDNPQHAAFLKGIQDHLINHGLTIMMLCKEIGVAPDSTHITFSQLELLGGDARAPKLTMIDMQSLVFKLEDRTKGGHIQISSLEQKLNTYGSYTQKRIEVTKIKDSKIQLIKSYMESQKQTKIDALFPSALIVEGLKVIDKADFLAFLESDKLKIAKPDCEQTAAQYESVPGSGKISLDKLQKDIDATQTVMTVTKAEEIVKLQIFFQIKRFLARNEVNIVDIFKDSDNGDGYFERKEIKATLSRLGFETVTDDHLDAIFKIYDQRQTNQTDYKKILDEFYQYANTEMIRDQTHRFYSVYEKVRNYMKERSLFSLSSIFLDGMTIIQRATIDELETLNFFQYLKQVVGIQLNAGQEQSLTFSIQSKKNFSKVDYQLFADQVGYEMPQNSANQELRKHFYRVFLLNIRSKDQLAMDLINQDSNVSNFLSINTFVNIIIRHCSKLNQDMDLIKLIANDFVQQGQYVEYGKFIEKINFEAQKLQFLTRIYVTIYETLEFKANQDMYSLFVRFDSRKDKQFDKEQLTDFLASIGITLLPSESDYLFSEYDIEKNGYITYQSFDQDYKEFIDIERQRGTLKKITNLPYILDTIKYYIDRKGQTLRQIFNKTKVGDNDFINQYQFQKIMAQMGQDTGRKIENESITKFMLVIASQAHNANQSVSFIELARLFNEKFHIQDQDDQQFIPQYIEKLQRHIAKVSLDNKNNNFKLEDHFLYPSSTYSQFLMDLNKDPLFCQKLHQTNIIDEMAKRYMMGGYVDTQRFIADLRDQIFKLEQKNNIFTDLRKQLTLKNLKIEDAFKRAIPEIQKFNLDYLSPKEFQNVFLFIEYKITHEKVEDLLNTFYQMDNSGKFSHKDFIEDYNTIDKAQAAGAKGRRFFMSVEDCLKRMAGVIEQRGLKTFGGLLADQDLQGKNTIEKDAFYRTIDSLQFGLGEGDIQTLIKSYTKPMSNLVDLIRFKDDLNPWIMNPEFKVILKSLLNQVVNERVVDVIDQTPRKNMNGAEAQAEKHIKLVKEITIGLYVKETDAMSWFTKYSSFVKGSLTNKEFIASVEGLGIYDDPTNKQAYYDNLVARQESGVGYKAQLLLIDQLNIMLTKDWPVTRAQAIDQILYDIALHLTQFKTPIRDCFQQIDIQGTGLIYRNDFTSTLLDNYLHIPSPQVLNFNRKILLTTRYAPNESYVNFPYDQFIQDLVRQSLDHPREIRIFMTKAEVDEDILHQKHQEQINNNNPFQMAARPAEPEPEANSKKNTVCIDSTCKKSLRVQIPSFQFDEIMLQTYLRSLPVESHFKAYSKYANGLWVLVKEDFLEAIMQLGVAWAKDGAKVSEMFDALDMAANGNINRYLTPSDIGEAVLQNAIYTIEDYQAKTLDQIYKALKQRQMLGKLRDLFNFYNTRRDNTVQAKDFQSILLDKLEFSKMGVQQSDIELLVLRYRALRDGSRVDFTLFIKDMEYCDLGISPSLIWAIHFAEDIVKGLILVNLSSPEQLFNKYAKMQGIMLYEEFKRAIDELHLEYYHQEDTIKDFFNHVQMHQNKDATSQGNQQSNFSKVSHVQLVATIKKLCQKSIGQIYQDILEKIFAESKKNNLSITVYTIFTDYDYNKTGHVPFEDFKAAIELKMGVTNIRPIDLQVLARRYRSNQRGIPDDMVQYEKFYQDYEKIEKLGLTAGYDPLKQKQMQESQLKSQQPVMKELTPEVLKIYSDMANYCKKMGLVDKICDLTAKKDHTQRGMLQYADILEVYKTFKITLNTKQMNMIIMPLPRDELDGAFNILYMIELLFGKEKALEIQQKYRLQGITAQVSQRPHMAHHEPEQPLEMSERLRDLIEVNFHSIQAMAHSISKGSFKLKEQELLALFRRLNLVLLSVDLDLLPKVFRQLKSPATQAITFQDFLQYFSLNETTSLILRQIQQELAIKNIKLEDLFLILETLSFEDFNKVMTTNKIDLSKFKPEELNKFFTQIAQRKEKIDKIELIRLIRNEQVKKDEVLPFIVNDFLLHIFNKNIPIPPHDKITIAQFHQWKKSIQYSLSPKDEPLLFAFFTPDNSTAKDQFSLDKIRQQLSKFDPSMALPQQKISKQTTVSEEQKSGKQAFSKQLSQFTPRIKMILTKINAQMKSSNVANKQLFIQLDTNKNGLAEKAEFVKFFTNDFPVKGLAPGDYEVLFDALDMNKDGYLSVNEFCLCLEGVQMSLDQRMKTFDLDLEISIKAEINALFDFFDTNKDGFVSEDELTFAMRSVNPYIGSKEVKEILIQADTNKNGTIDRNEFMTLMLPRFKQELLSYESNLDDLRRLFKEADLDQSNYLSREEMRGAMMKLSIDLTEVQLDELMRELDLDSNQSIDIDEFIAFLSIADQIKFKNPANKTIVVKIKQSRKLHPMDFYNCFKNLPQFFQPSFTQEYLEKRYVNTPSHGLYPEFESKSMTYKDLMKLEDVTKYTQKKFLDIYGSGFLACEIQLEEITGVPMPKKEDFDWAKISHRELRCVLWDAKSHEFVSNSFILGATWRTEHPTKWLFNTSESLTASRSFLIKTDLPSANKENGGKDIHLLFELVLYTNQNDTTQQVCCAWGTIPSAQFDKVAKHKVALKGGSPFNEMKIDQADIHQEKKGFAFLKRSAAASTEDPLLILSLKPFAKFQEPTQFYLSTLPNTLLISKRLLTFASAFRVYCYRRLAVAQQQMCAPQGNFVIAQFRKIFDNPDVQFILGDCWDLEVNTKNVTGIDNLVKKMEDFMIKLYAIIYQQDFHFDHVFPTRASPLESERFFTRDLLIKQQILPGKFKMPAAKKGVPNKLSEVGNDDDDYKPFNIAEMEIAISGINPIESKQDELIKMYQQMGLIQ